MKVGDEVVVVGPSVMGRTSWVGKTGVIKSIGSDDMCITENSPYAGTYPRDHVQPTKSHYIKKFIEYAANSR